MVFSRKWWKVFKNHSLFFFTFIKENVQLWKENITFSESSSSDFTLLSSTLHIFCRKFCKVIWCSSVNSSEFFWNHAALQRSEFNIIPLLHRYKTERSAKHFERCNVAWFQKDSYELTELHHITLRNFLQSRNMT